MIKIQTTVFRVDDAPKIFPNVTYQTDTTTNSCHTIPLAKRHALDSLISLQSRRRCFNSSSDDGRRTQRIRKLRYRAIIGSSYSKQAVAVHLQQIEFFVIATHPFVLRFTRQRMFLRRIVN